jgi:hypothetical protein
VFEETIQMSASSRRAAHSAGAMLLLAAVVLPARPVFGQHGGAMPAAPAPGHAPAPVAHGRQGADPVTAGPAALRWNARARPLVGGHGTGGMATRPLALLSVAQQQAGRAAGASPAGPSAAARDLAVAAASAEVLAALYPAEAPRFRAALQTERTTAARAGLASARLAAADSAGRAAAAQVLARAATDKADAAWTGTVPTGAGLWTSAANVAPVGAAWAGIRPWVLASADQFRPAAPPAVGTPTFAANLEEVRRAVANRTPAQLASARKWAEMPLVGYWNQVAADLATRARLSDAKAAEVLASLNVALMDANIACFDAKYAHWSIRPSQADPRIDVPVALPNFPAYVSGHACLSGAAAEALGHHFPARRAALDATAQEIADSRVYAGVHYRIDNEVGMEIGRKVARLVVPAVTAGLDLAPSAATTGAGGAAR